MNNRDAHVTFATLWAVCAGAWSACLIAAFFEQQYEVLMIPIYLTIVVGVLRIAAHKGWIK